jgi:hypothetical protein
VLRVSFKDSDPRRGVQPLRADVAAFVGAARRRPGPLSESIAAQLRALGWEDPSTRAWVVPEALLPIPVDAFDDVERWFAWDARPLDAEAAAGLAAGLPADRVRAGLTWLGAAIRSFFANGGRRAWIVPTGAPWAWHAEGQRTSDWRRARLTELLPGSQGGVAPSPLDPTTWRGLGALHGLPEVSFVALPDLADLLAPTVQPAPPPPLRPPAFVERFVVCAPAASSQEPPRFGPVQPPAVDGLRLAVWREALRHTVDQLRLHHRELTLLADLPPLRPGVLRGGDLLTTLTVDGQPFTGDDDAPVPDREPLSPMPGAAILGPLGLASAFVQLGWPWLRTVASAGLPGGAEPPCGALAGLLARNALTRGTFRSAVNAQPVGVLDLVPSPDNATLRSADAAGRALTDRLTVLTREARQGGGALVLSDVTTSEDAAWRPASSSRLLAAIRRAARADGDPAVFQPNGPAAWSEVQDRMTDLLRRFRAQGALAGGTEAEAFTVRCDRSTMTQADLDAGRLICTVAVRPAPGIHQLVVSLAFAGSAA